MTAIAIAAKTRGAGGNKPRDRSADGGGGAVRQNDRTARRRGRRINPARSIKAVLRAREVVVVVDNDTNTQRRAGAAVYEEA